MGKSYAQKYQFYSSYHHYTRDPGCIRTYVQILICVRSTAQYPSVKIRESICIFNDDVLVIYYAPTYWKYAPPSYCNIGL